GTDLSMHNTSGHAASFVKNNKTRGQTNCDRRDGKEKTVFRDRPIIFSRLLMRRVGLRLKMLLLKRASHDRHQGPAREPREVPHRREAETHRRGHRSAAATGERPPLIRCTAAADDGGKESD